MHFFDDIFRYNHWANSAYITALESKSLEQKCYKLFSHLLNTQIVWMERAKQQPPTLEIWQEHSIADFPQLNKRALTATLQLLDDTPTEKIISYQNSKGDTHHNSFAEILFHVVNHASYHRGQVSLLLKEQGVQPPMADYIFYKRN